MDAGRGKQTRQRDGDHADTHDVSSRESRPAPWRRVQEGIRSHRRACRDASESRPMATARMIRTYSSPSSARRRTRRTCGRMRSMRRGGRATMPAMMHSTRLGATLCQVVRLPVEHPLAHQPAHARVQQLRAPAPHRCRTASCPTSMARRTSVSTCSRHSQRSRSRRPNTSAQFAAHLGLVENDLEHGLRARVASPSVATRSTMSRAALREDHRIARRSRRRAWRRAAASRARTSP